MEKVDNKIDNIIAKLQQVLEKNNTLKKEVGSVKTKSTGLTEKERVDIKKKIKSYIADIDGFLTKTTA